MIFFSSKLDLHRFKILMEENDTAYIHCCTYSNTNCNSCKNGSKLQN